MDSFYFLWELLKSHGVVNKHKADASRVWDGYTLDEQRLPNIYCFCLVFIDL